MKLGTLFLDEHGITHVHEFGLDNHHMACGYLAWKAVEKMYGHRNARGRHPTCLWCAVKEPNAIPGL